MAQYEKIIEVFLNTSAILCFVWGPMKFCLQVASTWAVSFDDLLDAYEQLAENIPLFGDYQAIFGSNVQMHSILAVVYEDILEFHQIALRFFKRPAWKQLFQAAWNDFRNKFQHILNDLSRHKSLVESRANIVQIKEAQDLRAEVRNTFAALEEDQRKKRHLQVIGWLSAPNEIQDQEAATRVRCENPSSGQWLLQDSKIKTWMDKNNSLVPSLWMNGMPGAGKTILASVVVEACQKIASTTTVYFYCSYQDEQRKTFLSVAREFLAQLLIHNESLLPYLHEQCLGSGQASLVSSQLCEEILKTCFKTMGTVYIIIDGIDECEYPERKTILSFATSLIENSDTPGKLRSLFVSQDENDIRRLLRGCTVLRLTESHNRSDIETYATQKSQEIQQKFELLDETKHFIIESVVEGSEGMFLFAKLVLTNLMAQVNVEDLRKELQPGTFPKGFEQALVAPAMLDLLKIYFQTNIALKVTALPLLPDTTGLVWFLIQNENVKVHEEEQKLAVLCIQYLLFDCFDANLPEEATMGYIDTGYYAFQDYAIMHWIDHLESVIPHLSTVLEESAKEISSAIIDYFAAYGPADEGEEDIPQELKDRCIRIQGENFYTQLLLLITSTRKLRSEAEKLADLGELGGVISKNRLNLENMYSSPLLEPLTKAKLDRYYGSNWYRCPRHACWYFHDGFPDDVRRDNHVGRHEKPFLCTVSGCTRRFHGFSTERELKKHMNKDHPDPANLFPKVKKPAAKHTCDICLKDFTRAHNLKAHKNSHANERPYKCNFCDKAFVRKHDRERHVEKRQPEKNENGEDISQESALGPVTSGQESR
ncbi:hypothetical protein EG329_007921 [Mollisiaceae sp. DMI_Dod_QoI]|nr:hypothetical protein EG329_007921 [Helotiales sp. DMI_Dod_QoI]